MSFYIGREEEFLPCGCFFRLSGEREDVWRPMARPADFRARAFMYRYFGCHVAAVMRRPEWVFDNQPQKPLDLDARLVGGLLDGQLIWDRIQPPGAATLEESEDIKQVAHTVDGDFELTYHRPANDRSAHFVSQEVWVRPSGFPSLGPVYKCFSPSQDWGVEHYDAEEDDREYGYLISE